jgi:hypothetical protein
MQSDVKHGLDLKEGSGLCLRWMMQAVGTDANTGVHVYLPPHVPSSDKLLLL